MKKEETLWEKMGDVKVFPHHEVFMVEDVKQAIEKLVSYSDELYSDEVSNDFRYKAKKIFGEELLK